MQYYDHIIIDLNNLFWRTMYSSFRKKLDDESSNLYASTIQDVLKRIREFNNQYGSANCKTYLCCDNPFSKINERKEIYPNYKHARKNKNLPIGFYKTLDTVIEILSIYDNNFFICRKEAHEADDMVPIILKEIDSKENVLLISADLDWARSINNSISWFNYSTLYTIKEFENEYGFSPKGKTIQMYKAIHGDTSDCIENAVPYLPKNILLELVKYNSIKEMLVDIYNRQDILSKEWLLKIQNAEGQLRTNYALVDYINNDNLTFKDIAIQCKENIKRLQWTFKVLDIPFESRMINKNDASTDSFFKKKKHRRAK